MIDTPSWKGSLTEEERARIARLSEEIDEVAKELQRRTEQLRRDLGFYRQEAQEYRESE